MCSHKKQVIRCAKNCSEELEFKRALKQYFEKITAKLNRTKKNICYGALLSGISFGAGGFFSCMHYAVKNRRLALSAVGFVAGSVGISISSTALLNLLFIWNTSGVLADSDDVLFKNDLNKDESVRCSPIPSINSPLITDASFLEEAENKHDGCARSGTWARPEIHRNGSVDPINERSQATDSILLESGSGSDFKEISELISLAISKTDALEQRMTRIIEQQGQNHSEIREDLGAEILNCESRSEDGSTNEYRGCFGEIKSTDPLF